MDNYRLTFREHHIQLLTADHVNYRKNDHEV